LLSTTPEPSPVPVLIETTLGWTVAATPDSVDRSTTGAASWDVLPMLIPPRSPSIWL
jgi:hypothetical protein